MSVPQGYWSGIREQVQASCTCILSAIFNGNVDFQSLSHFKPGIMSEKRTTWLDLIVLRDSDTSHTRCKLIQYLSTIAQKAVDYIGGSKKVQMNIGGTFTNIVRFPSDNYCSYSLLTKNTVADLDV